MDPLSWFQQNVKVPSWMKGPAPSPGGAIVPKGGSLVPSPGGSVGPAVQSISTNLNVPLSPLQQTNRLLGGPLGAASIASMSPGSTPLAGTDAEYNPGPLLKATAQFPFIHVRGSEENPERSQRPKGFVDLRGSVTPGSSEPASSNLGEGAAMDAAERFRPGAGYPAGVERPADYPTVVPRGDGSDSAPDGSGAKGTNTGYKIDLGIAEGLLTRIGERNNSQSMGKIADINSFTSTALPTTTQGAVQQDIGLTGVALPDTSEPAVVEGISTPGLYGTSPVDTADNNRSISVPGENPEGSARNWMEPGAKSWSDARRAAFLDPNNRGYAAVRAANEATGTFRQGDKFFANDGGTLREIGEDTYRTASQRQLSPAELQAGYKEEIQATLVPVAQPDMTSGIDVEAALTPGIAVANSPQIQGISETEFGMNNNPPTGGIDREELKANYFK